MKTFKDLIFEDHDCKKEWERLTKDHPDVIKVAPTPSLDKHAQITFDNGFIFSVVTGELIFGQYECAYTRPGFDEWNTVSCDTEQEVTDHMIEVQTKDVII